MEFLVFLALIGLIPAAVAHGKGRDFIVWWFYGAAIFIVALPHALMMSPSPKLLEKRAVETGDSKKCPACAELVKREARICRFCGHNFEAPREPAPYDLDPDEAV